MELNDAIITYGLTRSQHDQCLYFRLQGEEWMAALFFVDDAIVCGTNKKALDDFVKYLKKKFELRTLPVGRFLGLTIKRDRSTRTLSLSQPDFVDDLVTRFKMESCHPNVIPAKPGLHLSSAMAPKNKEEEEQMKEVPYQSAVGALLYLSTTTRPDIACAVSKVAVQSKSRASTLDCCQTHYSLSCRNQGLWDNFLFNKRTRSGGIH